MISGNRMIYAPVRTSYKNMIDCLEMKSYGRGIVFDINLKNQDVYHHRLNQVKFVIIPSKPKLDVIVNYYKNPRMYYVNRLMRLYKIAKCRNDSLIIPYEELSASLKSLKNYFGVSKDFSTPDKVFAGSTDELYDEVIWEMQKLPNFYANT